MWKHGEQTDAWIVVALTLWLGVLATAAFTAAIMFPSIRDMHAQVPGLVLPEDEHWKYIAGKVQFKVFAMSDWVQLVSAAFVAVLMLFQSLRERGQMIGRFLWRSRLTITMISVLLLGYYLFAFMPETRNNLSTMWAALDKGDLEAAKVAQAAFDKGHPISSKILSVLLLLTFVNLLLTAASIGRNPKAKVAT